MGVKVEKQDNSALNTLDGFLNNAKPANSHAEELCSKAHALRLKKEHKLAIQSYLTSILHERHNPQAYLGMSMAYKDMKCYDKAIDSLLKAKKLSSFDSKIYFELGINYLMNAQPQCAVKNLIRSIKLNPDNTNAQIQLAMAHEMMGEFDLAMSIYDKIIEKSPCYIAAYNHKAGLLMHLEDFEYAYEVFKEILNINPQYYKANLGAGICLDKSGSPVKAIPYYNEYILKKPQSETAQHLKSRIKLIMKEKNPVKPSFLRRIK